MKDTAGKIKKVVVIGPESTGKSTLSAMLAEHFGTAVVPEYARSYIESLDRQYTESDLLKIAAGQHQAEAEGMAQAKEWLFCDTDAYVLKVWSEHKYGRCQRTILDAIAIRRYDHYLLTDIDMPWEADPQREHPEEAMRRYFFRIYQDIVLNSGVPWAIVSGNEEQRLQQAIAVIAALQ